MSASNDSRTWLDRWWLVLVILFGLIFVAVIANFSPKV
jgi:hypothetical protein